MNDAELVKSRLDIVEVISGYVELKKAGKDYRANSPFRQERTPSFYVSPDKQIWHDFGDNEGGDLISFVMRMEGMSFPEALEMLASRAGVELSHRAQSGDSSQKLRLYAASELAMKYYHLQLSREPTALSYIKDKRGLTSESIKRYKLGYAPAGWTSFIDYAATKGFTLSELKLAGLAGQTAGRETGYDLFRERIMFPVIDMQGRVIGFSGRLLKDDVKSAKYINSPETPIYYKSTAIFGLHQAKPAIREKNKVIIVEGHLDVISLAQHGNPEVVAVSGTALTHEQLKLLSRQAEVIQLCFDNDSAGRKAAEKAILMGMNLPSRLEVVSYEAAKDPDEMVRQHSTEWQAALKGALYAMDYISRVSTQDIGLDSASSRKALVQRLMPFIQLLKDKVEQENYLSQLAGITGVEVDVLREKVGTMAQPKVVSNTPSTRALNPAKAVTMTRLEQLEEVLLELLLAHPVTRVVLADLTMVDMSESNRPIFTMLKKHPTYSTKQLVGSLPDIAERVNILTLRGEHEYSALTGHELGLEAFTQVHTVQKHIYSLKKRALSRRIAAAEQAGNTAEATDLLQQYQALVKHESEAL